MTALLLAIGLAAGAMTTLAGSGGGLMVTLVLFMVMPPVEALTVTAPALLVSNVHRLWLYRRDLASGVALRYAAGAMPGAYLGGVLVVAVPELAVQVVAAGMALLAAARLVLGWTWRLPRAALGPGGAAVGVLSATTGGGGLLHGPMLLASGLSGRAYIATGALGAACVHVGRIAGYGTGGHVHGATLASSALLALGMFAGNAVGDLARDRLPEAALPRLEVAAVVVGVGLAVAGLV